MLSPAWAVRDKGYVALQAGKHVAAQAGVLIRHVPAAEVTRKKTRQAPVLALVTRRRGDSACPAAFLGGSCASSCTWPLAVPYAASWLPSSRQMRSGKASRLLTLLQAGALGRLEKGQ